MNNHIVTVMEKTGDWVVILGLVLLAAMVLR